MKTTPKYLSILGLALILTPTLQISAKEAAKHAAENTRSADTLDASFAAISETIQAARKQASSAVGERDKALAELVTARKQQQETTGKLHETLRQQAETAKLLAETRKELAESKSAQEKFKMEAEGLSKQLEVGNEAYAKLVTLRTQMQESLKNLAGIDQSIATFRAELASPTSAGKLQGEIAQLKGNTEDLGKQLANSKLALEKERQEREKITKNAEETEKQLAVARKQSEKIATDRSKMNARISDLEKSQAETVTALNNAKSALAQSKADMEMSAVEARKSEAERNAALTRAKEEISQLKEARKTAEETAEAAAVNLKSARKTGDELKTALQGSERRLGELEARMKEVSKKADDQQDSTSKGES